MKTNPAKLDPGQTELWNCENAFEFLCPLKWESLVSTESPDIRYCGVCSQNVYLCETPREFVSQGNLGRCVGIRKEVTPTEAFPRYFMGRRMAPTPESVKRGQQKSKRERDWWTGVLALNPTFNTEQIDETRARFKQIDEINARFKPLK